MLKLRESWVGRVLRQDIVRILSSAVEAVSEALAGARRAEAKIPERIYPRFGNPRMFADAPFLDSRSHGPAFMTGVGLPPQQSVDAQRRLEKLEIELREARAQSSAEVQAMRWAQRNQQDR